MNLRPGHKEKSVEINLTPLIDVVFLLLIFFMVTTTFDRHAALKVSLPEASAKKMQKNDEPITLSIDANGNYFIDDRQILNQSLDTLMLALKRTIGKEMSIPDAVLVLRADANTPHQSVVRAMDAASQIGLIKLSISTMERQ